jgi:predicted 2-oxoglutarate/Fe(II)-dependent dioxygenase YbiX
MMGLVRGDPVPNFRRYDHRGELRKLYDDLHNGQAIALLVVGAPVSAALAEAVAALGKAQSPGDTDALIGLMRATVAQCQALSETHRFNFPMLADDGTLIDYLVGPRRQGCALTILALDTNLRVLERLEAAAPDSIRPFGAKLARLYQQVPATKARMVDGPAPVLMIPRVFEPAFCDELMDRFRRHGGTPSGVTYIEGDKMHWEPNPSIKMRKDYFIEDQRCEEKIKALLARRVLPEIQKCFNYTVTQHERFKLICYESETGGYFRPHRDNSTKDAAHRRFAMTINLNTGDYEGGALRFPEFGPHFYAPERGGAIVFSCSLVHEAYDVTQGTRYAMLGFFFGKDS